MELFDCIGSNTAGTVGLHSEAINSPITGSDSPSAGTYNHADAIASACSTNAGNQDSSS